MQNRLRGPTGGERGNGGYLPPAPPRSRRSLFSRPSTSTSTCTTRSWPEHAGSFSRMSGPSSSSRGSASRQPEKRSSPPRSHSGSSPGSWNARPQPRARQTSLTSRPWRQSSACGAWLLWWCSVGVAAGSRAGRRRSVPRGFCGADAGFRGQPLGGASLVFFLPGVPCGENPLVADDEQREGGQLSYSVPSKPVGDHARRWSGPRPRSRRHARPA